MALGRPAGKPTRVIQCESCRIEFMPWRSDKRFCSKGCFDNWQRAQPRQPLADRFWAKVDKSGECWLWTGARSGRNRYGYFGLGGKRDGIARAHRVAYELTIGSIPDGMVVCHKCDTPHCVNPSHLFVGTPKDNTEDMLRKGRAAHQRAS